VGQVLDDLLAGKTTIRVANPLSDAPLTIESHRVVEVAIRR
jgi:hypothetical protein